MNEVEKMYSNAGPNRDCNLYKHFTECPMKHTQCEDCENFVYPPFTVEKQLELIKWLLKRNIDLTMNFAFMGNEYYISTNKFTCSFEKTFEATLARLINNLWQDLTDEERKQIKEILE